MSKIDTYGDYREPTVASHELRSQKSQDGDNLELARLGKKPVLRVSRAQESHCLQHVLLKGCESHRRERHMSSSRVPSKGVALGVFYTGANRLTYHVYRETLASCP